MPRKMVKQKPLIYVFCEGESEQCYTRFLKEEFEESAEIKYPAKTGLFDEAKSRFQKDPKYRNAISETDEIWFFFDVEQSDQIHCKDRFDTIEILRKLRKRNNIRVRLLMTTGCVEYWFLLHYQMLSPKIATKADKEHMEDLLKQKEPLYAKGNYEITKRIGRKYPSAVNNGSRILKALSQDGLPTLEDTDVRNKWLHQCGKTFTTVQEAIQYLQSL